MDELWKHINARSGGDLPTGDTVQKVFKSKKKNYLNFILLLFYAIFKQIIFFCLKCKHLLVLLVAKRDQQHSHEVGL